MSFAAPLFLLGGGIAAAVVVALHFLIRQQPERWVLPTARFVPASDELAPARSYALNDRLLLVLRVLAIAAAAVAFARPTLDSGRRSLVTVVIEDRSPFVGDTGEVSAAASAYGPDRRTVRMEDGNLSAALIRAIREAHAARDRADSVGIVLVSPVARGELDAATRAIRRLWPGGIRIHRIAAAPPRERDSVVGFSGSGRDPLAATLEASRMLLDAAGRVRVLRQGALSASDSAFARSGGLVVHWPDSLPKSDTIGAVATARTVLVASFARGPSPAGGTPVAWWSDGRVAATETPLGAGCLRSVAIPVTADGDFALRERLRRVVRDLLGTCGGARDVSPAGSASLAALSGSAPPAVARSALPPSPDAGRAALPWLLALSLLLLGAEQLIRRRTV